MATGGYKSILLLCSGRKNIKLFCLRDESIHIPKRRVCPMKTDRCYLDTLPVSTSTPPSRAPVCSAISVYVCIYQQKWDEKDTTIMIKAILVFNNHGKPRLSKFYQYFVSDSVIMCCCHIEWSCGGEVLYKKVTSSNTESFKFVWRLYTTV